MTNFERAIEIVLKHEGGYSNDPRDPGGETMLGITVAVARAAGYEGPMRSLPREVASGIYQARYWDTAQCEEYPWPLCLYVFDAAVNQGPFHAVKMLQEALGTVQDGVVGPTTRRLAKENNTWHHARFLANRARRYLRTSGFDTFGTGWLTRLFTLQHDAYEKERDAG